MFVRKYLGTIMYPTYGISESIIFPAIFQWVYYIYMYIYVSSLEGTHAEPGDGGSCVSLHHGPSGIVFARLMVHGVQHGKPLTWKCPNSGVSVFKMFFHG